MPARPSKPAASKKGAELSKLFLPGRGAGYWYPDPVTFTADELAQLQAVGFDAPAVHGLAQVCALFPNERQLHESQMPSQKESREVLAVAQSLARDLANVLQRASAFTLRELDEEALRMVGHRQDYDGLARTLRHLQMLAWRAVDRLPSKEPTRQPAGVEAVALVAPVVEVLNDRQPPAKRIEIKASGAFLAVIGVAHRFIPPVLDGNGRNRPPPSPRDMIAAYVKRRRYVQGRYIRPQAKSIDVVAAELEAQFNAEGFEPEQVAELLEVMRPQLPRLAEYAARNTRATPSGQKSGEPSRIDTPILGTGDPLADVVRTVAGTTASAPKKRKR